MLEPYMQDLVDDVAYELYVLRKVAPVLLAQAGGSPSCYDLAHDRMTVSLSMSATLGMTLETAVEQLGIRPLAFGAGWKVIDLLLERAYAAAGLSPSRGSRWTIAEKQSLAKRGQGSAAPLSNNRAVWERLLACYVATEDVRHSLVHRRATTGADGQITGVDVTGRALSPLTKQEQLSLIRAVQRAMDCMQQGQLAGRQERALLAELDGLSAITGIPPSGHTVVTHPPVVVRVPVEDGQVVDFRALRAQVQATFASTPEVDLLFELNNETFEAELENERTWCHGSVFTHPALAEVTHCRSKKCRNGQYLKSPVGERSDAAIRSLGHRVAVCAP